MNAQPYLSPSTPGYTALAHKALALTVIMALQFQSMAPALAALSQVPLLSTSAANISPNVILTLDNSESMALNHMPENLAGTNFVRMHPDDNLSTETHIYLRTIAGYVPATGSCGQIFECKMRSSGVNTIYYNPAILYQPWKNPANPSDRLAASAYTAARVDPNYGSTNSRTVDLSAVTNRILSNWCTSSGNCASASGQSLRYNPGIFYKLTGNPELASGYKLYDLNSGGGIDYGRSTYPNRTDCPATGNCTLTQEQQNFANWFTYYRSRILFTKAAVSEAFADQANKLRLGWGFTGKALESNTVDGFAITGGPVQGVRDFDAAYKVKFLTAIQQATLLGSTPLRYAMAGVGEYFQRQDKSPWLDHPESGSGNALSCRRAYNILTTDGYYNDNGFLGANYDTDPKAVGNVDGAEGVVRPYFDANNANSLADIAMKYWATDLQTGIANEVPTNPSTLQASDVAAAQNPSNDPANWQHLTQFTLGIGVSGSLNPATDLPRLQSGALSWPIINSDAAKIDDLWHAAVNSRGKFFQVSNPKDLADALNEALTKALVGDLKQSGVATTTVDLTATNYKYIPQFNAAGWTGDIKAYLIDSEGDIDLVADPAWTASKKLPGYASRNIWSWNPAPDERTGVPFSYDELKAAKLTAALPQKYQNTEFIDYIRGDASNEGIAEGKFRPRTSNLPDFINSTPVLVKSATSVQYNELPNGGSTFLAYVAKKAKREGTLFIGGNGGMLHGFNENTGVESFAYVPHNVIPNLYKLADKAYGDFSNPNLYHQYYVDGPLTEADAYISSKSNTTTHWTNVVVGTLGAGGAGVFAIDVTGSADDASAPTMGGNNILWEVGAANDENLGKITTPAQVGVLQDGGWKVFVGNGYDSSKNRAALLVIDLSTGAVEKTFLLGPDNASSPNGLGGITLVRNTKNEVISAYAGDLQGNLWRVDFAGSTPATWTVGFGGKPLFTTPDKQPITAAPAVAGRMVIFGTGSLLTAEDRSSTQTQTIYGLWDDPQRTQTATKSKLVEQTILPSTNGLYKLSSNPVDIGANKDWGWYINLTIETKQRVIYPLQIINNLVYVPTIVPTDPEDSTCKPSPANAYNFIIPYGTGAQLKVPVFDTNGDGKITSADSLGHVIKTIADGPSRLLFDPEKGSIQNTDGKDRKFDPCAAGGPGCEKKTGNKYKIEDRIWKQLVNPPTF